MKRTPGFLLGALLLAALIAAAAGYWQRRDEAPTRIAPAPVFGGRESLLPLPKAVDLPADKVALGRKLFFDRRLSHDDSISCGGCHDPTLAGADGRRYAIGINGATGTVNTPTVFNAALNVVQFWDGRAATLEEQAAGPVHNPIEMASNWTEVIGKLGADPWYPGAFARVYPTGMTPDAIVDAIAAFERTLLTRDSSFDRYLRGDESAISTLAKTGYRRFLDYGCASCHQGANVGGNMLQRFGVMADGLEGREPTAADLGRYNVTKREEDRNVFKVPGLRNVAKTAPYFHDGSVSSLSDAVAIMGRVQLGRGLSADDIGAIVAFLETLTGEVPAGATQ